MSVRSPIVLASASPRRADILSQLGVEFVVAPSDVDECVISGEAPRAYVERVAHDKVRAGLAALPVAQADRSGPTGVVLAADTIVVLDGQVLGKPASREHSLQMIRALVGRTHEVYTCVVGARATGRVATKTVVTEVTLRELSDAACAAYVATGEGMDKAGAYAAQGLGAGLIESIRGSYTNVVGLPAAETVNILQELGALPHWPTTTSHARESSDATKEHA